MPLFIFIFS